MSDCSKNTIFRCMHGLFFVFIGIAALFAGSVHNQETAEFKERGISTEAIVVRIETKTGGGGLDEAERTRDTLTRHSARLFASLILRARRARDSVS